MTPAMLARKVDYMPEILEYTSFVYFSPTAVGGSFYEYKDYINFIEQRGHYKNMPTGVKLELTVRRVPAIKLAKMDLRPLVCIFLFVIERRIYCIVPHPTG